jgi:hypothetical protein
VLRAWYRLADRLQRGCTRDAGSSQGNGAGLAGKHSPGAAIQGTPPAPVPQASTHAPERAQAVGGPQALRVAQQLQLAPQQGGMRRDEAHEQREQADVAELRHQLGAGRAPHHHASLLPCRHLAPVWQRGQRPLQGNILCGGAGRAAWLSRRSSLACKRSPVHSAPPPPQRAAPCPPPPRPPDTCTPATTAPPTSAARLPGPRTCVVAPVPVLAGGGVEVQGVEGLQVLQQRSLPLEASHLCAAGGTSAAVALSRQAGVAQAAAARRQVPRTARRLHPASSALGLTLAWQAQVGADGGHGSRRQRHPAAQVQVTLIACAG